MASWLDYTYKNQFVFFLLLLPVALFVIWFLVRGKQSAQVLKISSFKNFAGPSELAAFRFIMPLLRVLAISFFLLALARPQDKNDESYKEISSEGIDIVLAFDISESMLAMDFKPNRLEAARELATEFIHKRKSDRMGLVVFSGEAFTQCPLTTDKNVLIDQFNLAGPGMVEPGTAIGMGLATAVNRLRDSEAKSKVIVLLTDGVNNAGNINPATAADIAKEFGIRVYTIGVGKQGQARFPVQDMFGNVSYQLMPVEIDEPLLKEISAKTGGEYFRAVNNESLQGIYERIDQLEKSKINVVEFRRDPPEKFHIFALIAICLLLAEVVLKALLFKSPFW